MLPTIGGFTAYKRGCKSRENVGGSEGGRERESEGGKEREKKEESLCFGALVYFDSHGLLFCASSHDVLGARKRLLPPH